MLSRRERDDLTALTDAQVSTDPTNERLYRRCTQLTFQLARYERRVLILRCVGVVALCVASGTASLYIVAALSVATLTLSPLLCRDWVRLRNNIAKERRARERRWQGNRLRMIADLRDEIANGPVYAPRTELHCWNWRSLSWWTAQLANIVLAVSVALTLTAFHFAAWLAFLTAGVYAVFLWTMESLLLSTFVLQRKAVLDGMLANDGLSPGRPSPGS